MRLFIALQLDEEMKQALIRMQDEMRAMGVKGNYTPEENLHLTLSFIGEYPDPEVVGDVLETIPVKPFTMRLEGAGFFGDLFWAGIEENEELTSLVKRIRKALADAGIPFDRKRFLPHITLIRKASYRNGEKIPVGKPPVGETAVEGISLMRSDRGRQGMIYSEILYTRGR